MKLHFSNSKKSTRGLTLVECLAYLVVFTVLVSGGMVSFFLMLDNSTALHSNANDISRVLQTGERWRVDVRTATGRIQTSSSTDGLIMTIPHGKTAVIYRFAGDVLWRRNTVTAPWTRILDHVKTSQMEPVNRNQVKAWAWELELVPHRARARVPLIFSFEAVVPEKS
jgi:hypothetical protein